MADIQNTKYYNLKRAEGFTPVVPPSTEEPTNPLNPDGNPNSPIPHNSTTNKDGGDVFLNEFYHLTKAQYDALTANDFETKLLSQAIVQWTGIDYIFNCLPLVYKIVGVFKQILVSSQVTLSASDPTNPRIDGVYVDNDQVFKVRPGTPAPTPDQPTFDLATEIPITFILVPAASTTPTVTDLILYDENTESTYSFVGTGTGVSNDTAKPYQGTFAIKETGISNGSTSRLTRASDLDLSLYLTIGMQLEIFAAFRDQDNISLQWFDVGGTAVGNEVNLFFNKAIEDPSVANNYQFTGLPISAFGVGSTPVRRLDIKYRRQRGGTHPGLRLDIIKLEGGITQPPTPGSGIPEAPSDNKIKGRRNGAWIDARAVHLFYASEAAMLADQVNQEEGRIYFDGAADWIKKAASTANISDYRSLGGGGIADAPNDGAVYGRKNLGWVNTKPVNQPAYANQAAMLADQANQLAGFLYQDDTSTWAKLATSTGIIGDYIKVGDIAPGGGGADTNAVHYNAADSKTASEKQRARDNIGLDTGLPTNYTFGTNNNHDIARPTNYLRINFSGTRPITGFAEGLDAEEMIIYCVGGVGLLQHLNGSSLSNNQMFIPNLLQFTMTGGNFYKLKYDTAIMKWVLVDFFLPLSGEATRTGRTILTPGINNGLRVNTTSGSSGLTSGMVIQNQDTAALGFALGVGNLTAINFVIFGQGNVSHARSSFSGDSIRRDEQFLRRPNTVATAGAINNQALTAGIFNYRFSAATSISGFANPEQGLEIVIQNGTASTLTLLHQNAGSTATNRIRLIGASDLVIPIDGKVTLIYETFNFRWELKSKNF